MDPYGHNPYGAASASTHHYSDDGLGGLGGPPLDDDDGLGTGYDAPPPPVYQDDGLMFMPDLREPPGQHGDADMQDDAAAAAGAAGAGAGGDAGEDLLGAAIDAAFEEGQDGTARSKAQQDDSDAATEDYEADESDDGADDGEAAAAAEDPAVAEQHRQNAFARQCYDAMTEAQRNRLEAYRTSNLPKKTMRKVVQELTGVLPGNKDKDLATIALCSVTKMFVGEVVETARQIAAAQGHTGALLPSHIRAAHQVLCEDSRLPRASGPRKPMRLY